MVIQRFDIILCPRNLATNDNDRYMYIGFFYKQTYIIYGGRETRTKGTRNDISPKKTRQTGNSDYI